MYVCCRMYLNLIIAQQTFNMYVVIVYRPLELVQMLLFITKQHSSVISTTTCACDPINLPQVIAIHMYSTYLATYVLS